VKVKEWLGLQKTKAVITLLEMEGDKRLHAVLNSSNREKMADVTVGFLEAVNFIKKLEEGDLSE